MFDTATYALTQALYAIAFVLLVQCLRLLWKRPFPANAPKLVSGYPLVGALQFFFDRNGFCRVSKAASPTGNYSYYLGRHRMVGVCGPQGRKVFYESQDLDVDEGVAVLLPFVNLVEASKDPSSDTHTAYLRTTLRARLLRKQGLEFVPQTIERYITATLNHFEVEELIDPFSAMNLFYTQSTMAVLGVQKVAHSPELSRKVGELLGLLDGTFSAADMVIPWLLNPLHIRAVIGIGQLYVMLWRIVSDKRKEERQHQPVAHKKQPENMSIVQDLIVKGRSMSAILQANSPTVTSWLLVMLATNAHWMTRVRQEVDQVVSKYRKDGESADEVLRALSVYTWEKEFPLLHACLLETIRLVLGLVTIRKNISPNDVPIGDTGEVIPSGAYATYDLQEVTQDPEVYPDPQRWDPGRFLSDRAEHTKEYLAFNGFGAGRRRCLGKFAGTWSSDEDHQYV
ncbi:cytochrome P450 [Aspergillus vadensis CBS 113365]|uniref:Cytochrome P450 n=1 Tax=Aspergillus vadensis (strain CBS 113365 / IMI 142717 / IBT 24658) TaxID=1448311 RepID=A0A319B198_ASPVC|nr:cytochrome P450 [Aspergillus vadensis CBS 113365]PYH65915.1 cytochrome P450 [Aspergillus vadensis CBS 113365]